MIDDRRHAQIAEEAYKAVRTYCRNTGNPARNILGETAVSTVRAADFARELGNSRVVPIKGIPWGFGSWLFKMPGNLTQIALNQEQISHWSLGNASRMHAIKARCIVHEVGHLRLHPHLLQNAQGNQAAKATAIDEQEAWIFTFVVLANAIGDYALEQRRTIHGDDSPSLTI